MLQGGVRCLQRVASIDAALPPDICAFGDKPDIVSRRSRSTLPDFDQRRRNGRNLWQQWSDERAFFGQERFGYEKERIIPGTFFMAVYRQNCGAHC